MTFLLLISLTSFFFALTYRSAPAEFPSFDLAAIIALIIVTTAFQIYVGRLFSKFAIVQNYFLATCAMFNILFLNLVFIEQFNTLPTYGQLGSLLLGIFIISTFFDMARNNPVLEKLFPAGFSLAAVAVTIMALSDLTPTQFTQTAAQGKTASKNIGLVEFTEKPNVYFVSYDSLVTPGLLQKYVGLERVAYHEVLEGNLRRFANFFADRVATEGSLNSLLALDVGLYDSAIREGIADQNKFFSGWRPSPLLEIFKHNGYETTTYFRNTFFGLSKGPFVDNYKMATEVEGGALWSVGQVCNFIRTDGNRSMTYLGYCQILNSGFVRSYLDQRNRIPLDQNEALIRHMRNKLGRPEPQFFLAYVYSPGHTRAEYDHRDSRKTSLYQDYYKENSETTAVYLQNLINFVAREDPTAILYIFGDHGPITSRRVTPQSDSTFYYQDRYGVYGGIYPKDRCAATFGAFDLDGQSFMTVSKAAEWIIRCLAGNKIIFTSPPQYRLPATAPAVSSLYEDYLYE